jgi:ATP-dependent DNA helicase RecG
LDQLRGVGPKFCQTISKLGINRVVDLLLFRPIRYEDRTNLKEIIDLESNQPALIHGKIVRARVVYGKKRSLEITVRDQSGELTIKLFNFSKYQQDSFSPDSYLSAFGRAIMVGKRLMFIHPIYSLSKTKPLRPEKRLTPIYRLTKGINQSRIAKLVEMTLKENVSNLDSELLKKIQRIHSPQTIDEAEEARSGIAFQELCAFYISIAKQKALSANKESVRITRHSEMEDRMMAELPFILTDDQTRCINEIFKDLEGARPMNRLLQGDVGSGKTLVSALIALSCAKSCLQVAVMAPTEILAEQHFVNFSSWFEPLGIKVASLSSQTENKKAMEIKKALRESHIDVLIGTHALIQESVEFGDLGLVIIDEQHKFGVHQRASLLSKGLCPHQLVMTATPIPRTLLMTWYQGIDVSTIKNVPSGRKPIKTHTVSLENRTRLIEEIKTAVVDENQVYWVCPLIESNEDLDAMATQELKEELKKKLTQCNIAELNGKMSSHEKKQVMLDFQLGTTDILICTTIIEVGVDVPNASNIVIENSERFGLAQLHQLRGRVGRGTRPSRCFLTFKPGLNDIAKRRLNAMRESQDGFELAEQDLVLRGPGELTGTRQSGELNFRVADLNDDFNLVPKAIEKAREMLSRTHEQGDEINFLLQVWLPKLSSTFT